jgi:streptomycin 6-kinase
MNDDFIKHALTYGKAGEKWLKQIPDIIKTYERKWSLQVFSPYILSYNYVAPAIRKDGLKAVLKIGFPQDKEFQTEISALLLFKGEGSARVIEIDREQAVILIEQIVPGIPLSTIQNDDKATKILASVMKKLGKPLPQNHSFITIEEWTKALYEYPNRFKDNHNPPIPFKLVEKATALFKELINTSAPAVLTHADLHHDNVLTSDRDEWLSIDPKGIAAEPAYETAAMIRNPYKLIKGMNNIEKFLLNRIRILSKELNIDPKRIHKWCFAQTVLSGVWTSDDISDSTHAIKVAQALDRIII